MVCLAAYCPLCGGCRDDQNILCERYYDGSLAIYKTCSLWQETLVLEEIDIQSYQMAFMPNPGSLTSMWATLPKNSSCHL